ncbi:MAG: TonB-dependent receptor [Methylococcales bacterium]|nr:TonB-dependent receptor [Methylococcales bacterium]MDD5753834.1 TonB-dependent receptor [Methylococcales bacterium]
MFNEKRLLPVCLLCFITPIYAEESNVQKFDDMIVSAPIAESSDNSTRPVTVLSGDELRTKVGSTLGEMLQNELGVTNQSFGSGVGIPVIRGQSGSRVKVMQNSLSNNDVSSLSPDHATGVDPIIAERVEVLRGPSTLLYGSGAMGGIVNVIDNRIPEKMFDKVIGGAGEQRYDSATDESSSALKLEGGKGLFAYHVDGFYRDAGNTSVGGTSIDETAVRKQDPSFNGIDKLQNAYGFIDNTQSRARGGSAGFSMIGNAGLIGAAINQNEKNYGIPVDGKGETPVHVEMKQTKYDFKSQLNNPFAFVEKAKMKFGYTDYAHTEFEGNVAGTTFLNQTYESRFELEHAPFIKNNKGVLGFQSTNSQFQALGEGGDIVPKSDINTYGIFNVESLKVGAVTYEIGGRAESTKINPEGHNDVSYIPLSGSMSALWQVNSQNKLSLAFTHSQRAPQIQELFSNGFHDATHSYELGNANLKKELSNNLDLGYRFDTSWMQADINLFHNWVSDYIYQQRDSTRLFNAENEGFVENNLACAGCFPLLHSQQQAAIFKGFEAKTVFPLMQNHYGAVDLTLFGDYTRGTFENGKDVPRMPPLRYGAQINYEKNDWSSNLRFTRGEAQTHAGENETTTPAYLLLNIGTQYKLASFANSEILLFAKGKNLLDENIRSSVSYLRNFAPEAGRSAEVGVRVSY